MLCQAFFVNIDQETITQKGDISIKIDDKAVRQTFDRIAPGWYNFRHYSIFRNELEALAERWGKGSLLNVGSGHGADFLPFKNTFELFGLDFSNEMIKQARRYAHKFAFQANLQIADARYLPFAGNSFDWAISIATYHHIQGAKNRLAALVELRRVIKPGGEALVTVWNRCQPGFWFKGGEVSIPWKSKGEVISRYYHLFTYREMEGLVIQAGLQVLKSFPENSYHLPIKHFSRNICVLVKK